VNNLFYLEKENFLNQKNIDFIENKILSYDFPYYLYKQSLSCSNIKDNFFTHTVLKRKENKQDTEIINSPFYEDVVSIVKDFKYITTFYRIAINITFNNGFETCPIHTDHSFDHKQLIIYLNDVQDKDSKTVILDDDEQTILKEIVPKKYKAICFSNKPHFHYFPKKGIRVILVATFN
jgi:hypothetical protein